MQAKKYVMTAAVMGGLGAGLLGGAGHAAADPNVWRPGPLPPPGHVGQIVGIPPGQIAQWVGIPPSHWDKPWKW